MDEQLIASIIISSIIIKLLLFSVSCLLLLLYLMREWKWKNADGKISSFRFFSDGKKCKTVYLQRRITNSIENNREYRSNRRRRRSMSVIFLVSFAAYWIPHFMRQLRLWVLRLETARASWELQTLLSIKFLDMKWLCRVSSSRSLLLLLLLPAVILLHVTCVLCLVFTIHHPPRPTNKKKKKRKRRKFFFVSHTKKSWAESWSYIVCSV